MGSRWLLMSLLAPLIAYPALGQTRSLPRSIRAYLDTTYHRWILSQIAEDIRDPDTLKSPGYQSLVCGDFNRDGKLDYAVQISYRDSTRAMRCIIAFLRIGQGYKPFLLETMPDDNEYAISLDPKGSEGYDYETTKTFMNPSDGIFVGYSDKGGHSYFFRNGRFDSVITSD